MKKIKFLQKKSMKSHVNFYNNIGYYCYSINKHKINSGPIESFVVVVLLPQFCFSQLISCWRQVKENL